MQHHKSLDARQYKSVAARVIGLLAVVSGIPIIERFSLSRTERS
jgi:hypothetical protein